jgi:hypothetical protein
MRVIAQTMSILIVAKENNNFFSNLLRVVSGSLFTTIISHSLSASSGLVLVCPTVCVTRVWVGVDNA